MADYVIGDIQGCYQSLIQLLQCINFDYQKDCLWFVGDLVNRGPQSLEVLRFIQRLPNKKVVLGNHDLSLLYYLFIDDNVYDKSLTDVLSADDRLDIGHWLRHQPLMIQAPEFNAVISHAGIAPIWTIAQAQSYAHEVEQVLKSTCFTEFLRQMYGDFPNCWSEHLQGYDRLRLISNYFTRMRFCNLEGDLLLDFKGAIDKAPAEYIAWFNHPAISAHKEEIIFGHWAAIQGITHKPHIHAIDTGCVWGGRLTALRFQDMRRFFVAQQAI